jgi:hypothetical protein
MFATGSFSPTYSGPIYASGDMIRRQRNAAMAQSEFSGNQRMFNPTKVSRGIAAGSGAQQYQAGLNADAGRAEGFSAAQNILSANNIANAQSLLRYQANRADEQAGMRDVALSRDLVNQRAALDLRGLQKEIASQEAQRKNYATIQGYERNSSGMGLLAGLIYS